MGGGNSDEMGFPHRGQDSLNRPSSDNNTNPMSESENVKGIAMSSLSTHKSSNGADPFYASGWDPILSLSQNQNFVGSSMVSHNEFANSTYPGVMQNQGMSSSSHLLRYPSDSSFGEMVPKLPSFGSGGFSEIVGSFGLSDCGQITADCLPSYGPNKEAGKEKASASGGHSRENLKLSEEGDMVASPGGKKRKQVLEPTSPFNRHKNVEGELQKEVSGESAEVAREKDEKKQKNEQGRGGKEAGKQMKDKCSGDGEKNDYIHVRARKGQATNSHSLAERVRREKISERMRLLQEIVPGCNKITGKAVMLDEIINYVQSLQQQVEFLSMKLSTVNPEPNIDLEMLLSKDVLHSRSGGAAIVGFSPGMSSSQPFPHGVFHGAMSGIPSATQHYTPLLETVLDPELQNLFQMRYDPNSAIANLGPNGRLKSER